MSQSIQDTILTQFYGHMGIHQDYMELHLLIMFLIIQR